MNLLLDNVDEAKSDFEKAVELNPDFGVAYVQKCYTDYRYSLVKRDLIMMSDSMANFKKAIERFPDCSECYTLYAQVNIVCMTKFTISTFNKTKINKY